MLLRVILLAGALALTVAGLVLGYIAVFAARRSEGVFVPAGTVALLALIGAWWLGRVGLSR